MLVAESRMVMGKAHVFHVGSLSKESNRRGSGHFFSLPLCVHLR